MATRPKTLELKDKEVWFNTFVHIVAGLSEILSDSFFFVIFIFPLADLMKFSFPFIYLYFRQQNILLKFAFWVTV